MRKYGGVNNAVSLSEVEEATTYAKPPVHLGKSQVFAILASKTLKIAFWEVLVILGIGLLFVVIGSNS